MAQTSEGLEDAPLHVLFERGEQAHARVDSLCGPSSKIEEDLKQGCDALLQCQRLVEGLGIFSPNEEKDDLATGDIKYLLVPYYLADLTQRRMDDDRKVHVRSARMYLSSFVRACDRLGLLPEGEREAVTRDKPADAQARRTEKIARFKRQQATEAKLQELVAMRERRLRSFQAACNGAEGDADAPTVPEECDEEERELWFLRIGVALTKALDLLDALQREDELLEATRDKSGNLKEEYQKSAMDLRVSEGERRLREMRAAATAPRRAEPKRSTAITSDAIEGRGAAGASIGPMSSRLGHAQHLSQHRCAHQVFGPVSLMGSSVNGLRDRFRSEVFRPTHELPTYSIEQAGMMEMEMEKRRQADQAAAMEAIAEERKRNGKKTSSADSDEDEDDDEAVMKARAWDDWKDEHRRGEGNSKLTPCG